MRPSAIIEAMLLCVNWSPKSQIVFNQILFLNVSTISTKRDETVLYQDESTWVSMTVNRSSMGLFRGLIRNETAKLHSTMFYLRLIKALFH